MPWVYLLVAGVLEIVWAYTMKQSHGFSRLLPSIITISTMVATCWQKPAKASKPIDTTAHRLPVTLL
ncbi:SMR family transporter [Pseudomonas aeruginosa]